MLYATSSRDATPSLWVCRSSSPTRLVGEQSERRTRVADFSRVSVAARHNVMQMDPTELEQRRDGKPSSAFCASATTLDSGPASTTHHRLTCRLHVWDRRGHANQQYD